MKICTKCNKEKPYSEFNYYLASFDGYQNYCRDCVKLYMKKYNKNPPRPKSTTPRMKICSACRIEKPFIDFGIKQASQDGLAARCRDCQKKYGQKYNHHINLQKKYGISKIEYELMLKSQNEVCAICSRPETTKKYNKTQPLSVDHDHKTHKIRGLLCAKCNRSLGGFKDNPELLRKAANYLEASK